MRSVSVKLPSSKGYTMAATLDLPDGDPQAYALFSHCFTCNRFAPAASRISKTLAAQGIACLRFDYPGLGQSEGVFADTSFSENVEDLKGAYHWMEENYEAPELLIGHSLGGAAAIRAGRFMPKVRAVATVGAPFDPAHAVMLFADRIPEVDENGEVTMKLAARTITISRSYLEDLADINPEEYVGLLHKPLLILHSPTDQTVGIDSAQNIFLTARYPKSLVALDGADHLMTRPGTAARAANIIREWSSEYLTPAINGRQVEDGHARARTQQETKFSTIIDIPRETLTGDREKSLGGGKGQGPTPTDLVLSAAATGVNQAIRAYVQAERLRSVGDIEVDAYFKEAPDATEPGAGTIVCAATVSTTKPDEIDVNALEAAARDSAIKAYLTPEVTIELV